MINLRRAAAVAAAALALGALAAPASATTAMPDLRAGAPASVIAPETTHVGFAATSVAAGSHAVRPAVLPIPLQQGVNNPSAVKLWQQDLNAFIGLLQTCRPTLAVDGQFGPATTNATKCFQSAENISRDGIVGSQTRATMCDFLAAADFVSLWDQTCPNG